MAISTETQDNKALVSRFFEALDDHDLDAFDELFADDYTTGIYRSGETDAVDGVAGMKDLWTEYWEAFPDLHGVDLELIAEDDRVAFFRTEEGTHEGAFRGIAPTGNEITFEYGGYLTIEDGELVQGHVRGNMLDLLRQLDVETPLSD